MEMGFTLTKPSKPPVEVEIYRPVIPYKELTVGDIALSPLVQDMGYAEEIALHSGHQGCFIFIKEKVECCVKQHNCGKDGALPLLPDRVMWIESDNETRIRLLEPESIRAPYIALSYCWGPVSRDTFLTNAQTLDARKAGMEYKSLPPLFQDVVDIARALGIEYIWIDRLCIIQGDTKDFHSQAPKMGEIYGNATLTIAAASATSENDRILALRDKKWKSYNLSIDFNGISSIKLRVRRVSHTLGQQDAAHDYGKMATRAWVWQERLLASRTVFFTASALKFECRCHSVWEGYDEAHTSHSWSAQLDNVTHLAWAELVEEFMRRDVTRPYDRLPAMEAVMKRIEKSTGWAPFWGLWANALIESLCWSAKQNETSYKPKCQMNPGHYAPTWSWASVNGPISYSLIRPFAAVAQTDPQRWDLECRSLNGSSGTIRVAGHLILAQLNVTIERNVFYDSYGAEEDGLCCKYKIECPDEKEGFPIRADVALKPWSGNIGDQYVSTVIRAPYGEKPPESSWSGPCACILVAKTKWRALILLLGRSLRTPGAWERIAVADGFSLAAFSMSQRRTIDIV